jgi:F-type H+-transporting ATPase subunit delta
VLERILPQVAPTPEVQRFVLLLLDRRRIVLLARDRARLPRSHRRARRPGARRGDLRRDADPGDAGPGRRSLEQRTGKKVIINSTVNPDLIGGVVARVGDLVLDGSVRTQLEDLRARLVN